jgi:TolB-like protein/Tfp pilus assembly protein PilF
MAKVPADRFTSAADLAEALANPADVSRRHSRYTKMLAVGAALGVAGVLAAVVFRARSASDAPIASIAVLPPAGAGSDTAIAYVGEGLTETLINRLSGNPNLRVSARSAVSRFSGKSADPAWIGRELGVEAVLTWTLHRRGERLNIQAEVVKVADGSRLWGEQFDRPASELLDLQEQIATAVSRRLGPKPSAAQAQAIAKRPTANPEAYDFYVRARYLMKRRTGSWDPDTAALETAREYYEQAIAKDPNFALAWSGLGDYYLRKASGDHAQNLVKAETLIRRALAIDSTSADSWAVLGIVLSYGHHDEEGALRAFERGVALGPTEPEAHWYYGESLLLLRRFDEAIAQMQKAVDLDPVDWMSNNKLGWALLVARRYDAAIAQLQKVQVLAPDFAPNKLLGFTYERKGMYPEAVSATQKSLLLEGDTAQATRLVKAYDARGVQGYWEVRRAALLEELAGLNQQARAGEVDTGQLIWVHAQLGNRDRAFALLGTISDPAELRGILWIWLVDSLRPDPRFGELVKKAGLPLMEGER